MSQTDNGPIAQGEPFDQLSPKNGSPSAIGLLFVLSVLLSSLSVTLVYCVDPVVDRVERNDRLGCFVDRLHRL